MPAFLPAVDEYAHATAADAGEVCVLEDLAHSMRYVIVARALDSNHFGFADREDVDESEKVLPDFYVRVPTLDDGGEIPSPPHFRQSALRR